MPKLQEPRRFVKASAHELGHGAFGLEHPFRRHEGLDEFGMENLMSWNPTATKLCKYQWDLIQHPAYWLEGKYGSGESEAMVANGEDGYDSQTRTWTFQKGDTPFHIAYTLMYKYKEKTVFPTALQYAYFLILYNACPDYTSIPIGTVWKIPDTYPENINNYEEKKNYVSRKDYSYLITINKVANNTALSLDIVHTTLTSTKIGGDVAYYIAYNKILQNGIKFIKVFSYMGTAASIYTDYKLAEIGEESWTEFYANTVVTGVAAAIGGWPGIIIVVDYNTAKAYIKVVRQHPEWLMNPTFYSFTH